MVAPRPIALMDSTMTDLGCSSRPSCLKAKSKHVCVPAQDTQPSAQLRPSFTHQLSHSHTQEAQDKKPHLQWQFLRKRFWWRKETKIRCPQSPINLTLSQDFKERTRGRVFNCLARDHRLAQCRDPPTCLTCGGSGHISPRCRRKASYARHSPAQGLMERELEGRVTTGCNSEGSRPRIWHSSARHVLKHALEAEERDVGYPKSLWFRSRIVDPTMTCSESASGRHPRDSDKDEGRDRGRPHTRETQHRQSQLDDRGKDKAWTPSTNHGTNWYKCEPLGRRNIRNRNPSPPPTRANTAPDERRVLRMLWQAKSYGSQYQTSMSYTTSQPMVKQSLIPFQPAVAVLREHSDAIQIIPKVTSHLQPHEQSGGEAESEFRPDWVHMRVSDAIVIPLVDNVPLQLTVEERQPNRRRSENWNVQHTSASTAKQEAINTKKDVKSTNVWEHTQLPLDQNTVQEGNCSLPNMLSIQTMVGAYSPDVIRSEGEQLAGFELMKALRNFKQNGITHISPPFLQDPSPKKKAATARKNGILRCRPRLKNKLKPKKFVIKFTQEGLSISEKDEQLVQQMGRHKKAMCVKSLKLLFKLLEMAVAKKKKKLVLSEMISCKKAAKKMKKKATSGKTISTRRFKKGRKVRWCTDA